MKNEALDALELLLKVAMQCGDKNLCIEAIRLKTEIRQALLNGVEEVKRYQCDQSEFGCQMFEDENGGYVRYEDFQAAAQNRFTNSKEEKEKECEKCRGKGELWKQGYKGNKQPPHDMRHMYYKCNECNGLGFIKDTKGD